MTHSDYLRFQQPLRPSHRAAAGTRTECQSAASRPPGAGPGARWASARPPIAMETQPPGRGPSQWEAALREITN